MAHGQEQTERALGVAVVTIEVEIEAARERVWEAFCEETAQWWPADFRCLGDSESVTLEARAGGHLLERASNGATLLWGQVLSCTPGENMNFAAHIAPPFGGPAIGYTFFEFVEQGAGKTLVRLTNHMMGDLGPEPAAMRTNVSEGWRHLIGTGLKKHVEGG